MTIQKPIRSNRASTRAKPASIRAAKVVAALPVLEEIQKEGTSLFSGNYCIRGILPATIKELRGE